mmetsp:Transcript_28978/g.26334  ORF Transcript_28978/g.26334 Transcript_28978/m.26334 type:complete len:85 (+) Transcript_28978:2229-2483(+)
MQSVLNIILYLSKEQIEEDTNLIEFVNKLPNHITIEKALFKIFIDYKIGIKHLLSFFELIEEISFEEILKRVLSIYKENLTEEL